MYIIVDLLELRNQESVCIRTKPKNSDSLIDLIKKQLSGSLPTAMAEARMTKTRLKALPVTRTTYLAVNI